MGYNWVFHWDLFVDHTFYHTCYKWCIKQAMAVSPMFRSATARLDRQGSTLSRQLRQRLAGRWQRFDEGYLMPLFRSSDDGTGTCSGPD